MTASCEVDNHWFITPVKQQVIWFISISFLILLEVQKEMSIITRIVGFGKGKLDCVFLC